MTRTLSLMLALALPSVAQAQGFCSGPGAAFGVVSYQCASCAMAMKSDGRNEYSFHTEPVVLQARDGSPLRPGDIIVSVNDKPITTRAGADLFTYPDSVSRVQFRRAREILTLTFALRNTETCSARAMGQVDMNDQIRTNAPYSMTVTNAPPQISGTGARTGRFGFSLGCIPSCKQVKDESGRVYWQYEGYPTLQSVRTGRPAELAGLETGDLVLAVDGHSILDAQGAMLLQSSDALDVLTLTVRRRDGTEGRFALVTLEARRRPTLTNPCPNNLVVIVQSNLDFPVDIYGSRETYVGPALRGRTELAMPEGMPLYVGAFRPGNLRDPVDVGVTTQFVCRGSLR